MQRRGKQQFVATRAPRKAKKKQFEQFQATELYCPKCGQSMPVRQRLLLVLPEGDRVRVPVRPLRDFGWGKDRQRGASTAPHCGMIDRKLWVTRPLPSTHP